VYGAGGGVGVFAVEIAKALGAHVTAVTSAANLDLLRSLGADEVLDYAKDDLARGGPYDVFLDIGGTRPFRECRRAMTRDGTFVCVGGPYGKWFSPMSRLLKARLLSPFVSQTLRSFTAKTDASDLGVLKDFAEAGKLSSVIESVYPLAQTSEAIRQVEGSRVRGKVVVQVS
jgi:NADPH:quinone reductase-like Zn-dependent oxidoreductase